MQSFSTAAFVAAFALVPSALAANTVLKNTVYNGTFCSGEMKYATYTDIVVDQDLSKTDAEAYCAALEAACTEDDDGDSYVKTCTDSIDFGSGPYYAYYKPGDTSCATIVKAQVFPSTCTEDGTESFRFECSDRAMKLSGCSETSCGGTCDHYSTTNTTCMIYEGNSDGIEEGSYVTASCGDSSSDDVCFSGDDTLFLESGEAKRLSEVAIGDKVQTSDANGVFSFSEVVALPHAANNKLASFVNVATASGKYVKATKMHLLQQCDGSLAYAGSLVSGDCLRTVDGDETVTAASMTKAEGIYTAVTTNEFLVVNGIVASPFAVSHGLADAYYNIYRLMAKVFPSAHKSPLVLAVNAFLGGAFLTAGGSK